MLGLVKCRYLLAQAARCTLVSTTYMLHEFACSQLCRDGPRSLASPSNDQRRPQVYAPALAGLLTPHCAIIPASRPR